MFRRARDFNFKLALDVAWKAKNTIYPGLNMYDGTCSLNTDCGICKSKNSNGDGVTCATSALPSKSLNGICSTCMNDGKECCTTPTCGNTDGSGSAFSPTSCTSKSKLIKSDLSTISCSTSPCTDDDCCYLPAFVEKTSGKCTDLENGWVIKNKNDCVKANLEMGDREITVKEITKATQTPGCLPPVLPISGDRLVFNKNFDSASTCDNLGKLYAGTVLNIFDSLDATMVVDWATDKFTKVDKSLTSQQFSFYKYLVSWKKIHTGKGCSGTGSTGMVRTFSDIATCKSLCEITALCVLIGYGGDGNNKCDRWKAGECTLGDVSTWDIWSRTPLGAPITSWATDGTNAILSGDTVVWYHPSAKKVYDCAHAADGTPCTKQPWNGIPKGNWGSPYRIYKIGGNVGDAINLGDTIYFDR